MEALTEEVKHENKAAQCCVCSNNIKEEPFYCFDAALKRMYELNKKTGPPYFIMSRDLSIVCLIDGSD